MATPPRVHHLASAKRDSGGRARRSTARRAIQPQDPFRLARDAESTRIPDDGHDPKLEALIRMEVACRLALESLPDLPPETEKRLRVPIQTLCDVTQTELARCKPASG